MSVEPPCRPSAMEIDVTPVGQIADGALGDDERTETDRSPVENKSPPRGEETGSRAGEESGESGTGERGAAEQGSTPGEAAANARCCNRRKHRRGKNKAGRRHNRAWKPYNKLSWEERQAVDERETRRATSKREKQFAAGQPMAPYNTTQFLMEQHELEPQAVCPRRHSPPSANPGEGSGSLADSSEEYYDSPEGEDCLGKDVFLEKEFTETYENCHAERLQQLSKDELVREYLDLESRVDRAERRLHQLAGDAAAQHTTEGQGARAHQSAPVNGTAAPGSLPSEHSIDITLIKNLEEQIQKLKQDNEKLHAENEKLRTAKSAEVPEIVGES